MTRFTTTLVALTSRAARALALALGLACGLAWSSSALAAVEANQGSQAELETVKGIGPGLSSRILEARKSGGFKNWADFVERVAGVGEGNAARFSQAGLTVAGSAYAAVPKGDRAPASGKAASPASASPKPAAERR